MEMTQKEVFEALVQGLIGNTLVLPQDYEDLFDVSRNYFHEYMKDMQKIQLLNY